MQLSAVAIVSSISSNIKTLTQFTHNSSQTTWPITQIRSQSSLLSQLKKKASFYFLNELKPFLCQNLKANERRCSDQIIFARITNDERPLRRVIKKFHGYTSLSHPPIVPPITPNGSSSLEDAREAFLVDLASFQLLMKKSAMICEAEARQVEEYQRERQKLGERHFITWLYMPTRSFLYER